MTKEEQRWEYDPSTSCQADSKARQKWGKRPEWKADGLDRTASIVAWNWSETQKEKKVTQPDGEEA